MATLELWEKATYKFYLINMDGILAIAIFWQALVSPMVAGTPLLFNLHELLRLPRTTNQWRAEFGFNRGFPKGQAANNKLVSFELADGSVSGLGRSRTFNLDGPFLEPVHTKLLWYLHWLECLIKECVEKKNQQCIWTFYVHFSQTWYWARPARKEVNNRQII